MLIGEPDERVVTGRVGADGPVSQDSAGGRGDDGDGMGVFVGVDADDDLDSLCEHGQLRSPLTGTDVGLRSGSGDSAGL
jgi:hypothetical protein